MTDVPSFTCISTSARRGRARLISRPSSRIPVVFARMLISLPVLAGILLLRGQSPLGAEGLVDFTLIPTGWALFALITPLGGGWWWQQNMGGREPSEREKTAYQDAVDLLLAHADGPVQATRRLVRDRLPQPDAAVWGDTLMLSRGTASGGA